MFAEGQTVHLYVKGYELYEGSVVAADEASCTVNYSGGQGETKSSGIVQVDLKSMYYEDPENAPCYIVNPELSFESSDKSETFEEFIITEYDPFFNPEGYNDMTNMRKLNDCELARSLQIKFFANHCYRPGCRV